MGRFFYLLAAVAIAPSPNGLCPLEPRSCRRGLGVQGEERPLHPLTEAGVIPWASRGRVLALRAAGRTNPLTPTAFYRLIFQIIPLITHNLSYRLWVITGF